MKKDLQEYLGDAFNLEVYDALTEKGTWYKLYDPKAYFDLLYERFEIVKKQVSKPLDIVNDLRGLGLGGKEYYFLLDCLLHLIYDRAVPYSPKYGSTGSYKSLDSYKISEIPRIQAEMHFTLEFNKNLLSVFRFLKKEQERVHRELEADNVHIKGEEETYEEETDSVKPELKFADRDKIKTEFLRLFLSMYDHKMLVTADGSDISEAKFVQYMFSLFGEKLTNYHDSKSKALNVDVKTQVKLFDDLKKAAEKRLNDAHGK